MTAKYYLTEEAYQELVKLAQRKSWDDELNDPEEDSMIYDMAGGNIDDAYYGGHLCGRIDHAREVLDNLVKVVE